MQEEKIYDVLIVGGGPAGVAAGIYCARKKLDTILITDSFGGQSIVSNKIENWIGEVEISGYELAKKLEAHLRHFSDSVDIITGDLVSKIEKENAGNKTIFVSKTKKGEVFKSRVVIVCSGGRRRKLNVPGEKEFEGKGVFYCATCDAPLMKDKKVLVVGGGNAGLEAALELFSFAKEIYIAERSDKLKGDAVTREKVLAHEKLKEVFYNTEVKKINGDNFVESVLLYNNKTGESKEFQVDGVFVEIGSVPNSEIIDFVDKNKYGEIIVDSKYGTTSFPGVFAAGDVTDDPFKQNNIAVGDAIKCALSAFNYLQKD